jgi:hypothetical protein
MKSIRLTEPQVRWLNDPRPYSDPWRDRTFRALIEKGAVVVTERDFSSGKAGYCLTDAGAAAFRRALGQPSRSTEV